MFLIDQVYATVCKFLANKTLQRLRNAIIKGNAERRNRLKREWQLIKLLQLIEFISVDLHIFFFLLQKKSQYSYENYLQSKNDWFNVLKFLKTFQQEKAKMIFGENYLQANG